MYIYKNKGVRLLNELCHKADLEAYRLTLDSILTMILNDGCNVSVWDSALFSQIESSEENGSHIRIGVSKIKNPLNIIWTLLHEYGQFISGPKNERAISIDREELGWLYADELVNNYPQLLNEIDSYRAYREESVETYRKHPLRSRS